MLVRCSTRRRRLTVGSRFHFTFTTVCVLDICITARLTFPRSSIYAIPTATALRLTRNQGADFCCPVRSAVTLRVYIAALPVRRRVHFPYSYPVTEPGTDRYLYALTHAFEPLSDILDRRRPVVVERKVIMLVNRCCACGTELHPGEEYCTEHRDSPFANPWAGCGGSPDVEVR